ncbi:MAG TPA: GAF and ANTAR domain-containing protein [Mycobacteriales bacterium]|nr:GAF and ANTAR domain-containing protein [Mycobacteriales bacterium]
MIDDEAAETSPAHGGIPAEIDASFQESVALLEVSDDVDATMLRVASVACTMIEGCSFCSVSELADDALRTRGASDPRAEAVDKIQYETRQGPCWVAATEREPLVYTADTSKDERWPDFSKRTAAEVGVFSLVACRLVVGDPPRALGALNMYGEGPSAFDGADMQIAMLLAAVAGVLLDAAQREAQLTAALETRGLIGQAMGILMAQSDITADEAFAQLRGASQRMNVKLRDLAKRIAESSGAKREG